MGALESKRKSRGLPQIPGITLLPASPARGEVPGRWVGQAGATSTTAPLPSEGKEAYRARGTMGPDAQEGGAAPAPRLQ